MKKFLSILIVTGILSGFGFVNPNIDISPKVIDVFNQFFTDVKDVKWFTAENSYIVTFEQNGINTRIDYDKGGNFLSSKRYYSERNLPFNILLKIKEKYNGKTIKIVTEIIEDNSILYSINIEDEQNVYIIESNSEAYIHLVKKYKKQNSGE